MNILIKYFGPKIKNMKTNLLRLTFTFCALFLYSKAQAQEFATIWNTTQTASSADNEITIPTNAAYTYNYTVDWGDGNTDTNVTGNITQVM